MGLSSNLGETALRKRRRAGDPMAAFDALPPPLRRWLADARLPWSPTSARRIWNRARARGLGTRETLDLLDQCETNTLGAAGR